MNNINNRASNGHLLIQQTQLSISVVKPQHNIQFFHCHIELLENGHFVSLRGLVQPQMNDGWHSYYTMIVLLGCGGTCSDLSPVNMGHSTACHPAHTNNRLHENTKLEMLDPPLSQTIVRCKSTFTQLGVGGGGGFFAHAQLQKHSSSGRRGGNKKKSSHTKPRLRVAPPNTREVAASF